MRKFNFPVGSRWLYRIESGLSGIIEITKEITSLKWEYRILSGMENDDPPYVFDVYGMMCENLYPLETWYSYGVIHKINRTQFRIDGRSLSEAMDRSGLNRDMYLCTDERLLFSSEELTVTLISSDTKIKTTITAYATIYELFDKLRKLLPAGLNLHGTSVAINGKHIGSYDEVISGKGLSRVLVSRLGDKHLTVTSVLSWLIPVTNEPWRPGYFGKCPYCGGINNGMYTEPHKFCPHCGKQVSK